MSDLISRAELFNRLAPVQTLGEAYAVIQGMPEAETEIVRCKDCIYYDPEHIENNGLRYEYKDMPKKSFDIFGIGVTAEYGINVGGRCCRDYNVGYSEDKRVFIPETNYCGRAERRTNGSD